MLGLLVSEALVLISKAVAQTPASERLQSLKITELGARSSDESKLKLYRKWRFLYLFRICDCGRFVIAEKKNQHIMLEKSKNVRKIWGLVDF